MFFEKADLVSGEAPLLAESLADDDVALADHGADVLHHVLGRSLLAVGHAPCKRNGRLGLDVAVHRRRELAGPTRAPVLAVAEDLDARLALRLERRQDGLIFDLAELIESDLAASLGGMCVQHLFRP